MIKPILVSAAFLIVITACSKKDNTNASLVLSKATLLGTWNITSEHDVEKTTAGTILFDTTKTNFPNSYFDFRNNDSIYNQVYNEGNFKRDTLHYMIQNNQIFTINNNNKKDTITVKQLTKNKLTVLESTKDIDLGQVRIIEATYTLDRQ